MFDQAAFSTALTTFEATLENPIVPGELQSWAAEARQACDDAVTRFAEHVPTWHTPLLEEIGRQAPDLDSRVTQLCEEDEALLKEARHVQAEAARLASDADVLASHEPTVKQEVTEFIDSGLNWIIRARKQEAAVKTWYQESFNRDTGIAD